jgi:hypothetical protein
MEVLIYWNFQIQYMPFQKLPGYHFTSWQRGKTSFQHPGSWFDAQSSLRWKTLCASTWKLGPTDYHLWKRRLGESIKWSKVKHWLCMRWWWLRCPISFDETKHLTNHQCDLEVSWDQNPCFTLDAGANVHVLYPENDSAAVLQFIKDELVGFCQNGQYICEIGNGSKNWINYHYIYEPLLLQVNLDQLNMKGPLFYSKILLRIRNYPWL